MKNSIPQPDRCIACTTCTVVCPVAQATPNFLGPRMIGPAHERFRLAGLGEDLSLHYCANCKNCDISCPHDVPVSAFIMRARNQSGPSAQGQSRASVLRDWILAHGAVMGRWLRPIPASLKNFGLHLPLTRTALDCLGIAQKAPLPDFAPKTFRTLFRDYRQRADLPRDVVYFPGCYVDMYDQASGLDMVKVLNRAGYRVILPDGFTCCGLPMVANGFWQDAKKCAATNMQELANWHDKGTPVLTGCPSCALMVKEDYLEYFPELAPTQPVLVDACEFLLECIDKKELSLDQATPAGDPHVLYHAPCHLRAQGLGLPGLELLKRTPGLRVEYANAGCCGIAGSYGFKKDKYPIAMQVGSPLFEAIRRSNAPLCASECGTCRMQMRHGSGKEARHPISIIRDCLDNH